MLVWSNIFNIAFASALGVLILFFLISTIVVAAKGKRKCNAFDVILRILSTLVFIASAAMLAAAVLMLINGGFRIAFAADIPLLVIGETVTELPLPELFVALSSSIGLMLVALLFVCSLAALIVDCLVANKKTKKVKKQPVQKTPEQLKREAELDKIRKIGEDAVKRAGHAAKYAELSPQKKAAPSAQTQAQSNAQAQAKAQVQASATQAAAAEQSKPPEPEVKPERDWRTQTEQERPTEFVGLSKTNDPDFDTFDSFDDVTETPAEETDDSTVTERDSEPEQNAAVEDEFYMQEQDEIVEPEQEDREQDEEYWRDEMPEPERDEFAEAEIDTYEFEQTEDEKESDDFGEPETEDEFEQEQTKEPEQEPVKQAKQEKPLEDEYEPDRDIYIPRIRTIVRNNGKAEPAEQPKQTAKSTGGSQARKRSTSAKKPAPATKSATKPATEKPAVKTSAAKKPAPKKSAATSGKTADDKKTVPTIPPEKKLPITRRYVILDRRNAVNMFGEYLKDRNQAEKDRLKSSINTIIIE